MIINILNKYIYTWKREDEDDEQGEEEEELEDASPESSTNNKPLTAGVGMMEAEEGGAAHSNMADNKAHGSG